MWGAGTGLMASTKQAVTLALATLLFGCGAAQANEAQFTQDMLSRFKKANQEIAYEVSDALTLKQNKGRDDEAVISLNRVWEFCKNVPDDCERVKAEFVEKIGTIKLSEIKAADLRVMVRDEQYVEYLRDLQRKQGKDEGTAVIYEQIGSDLYTMLAADSENSIELVNEAGLKKLGLGREAAFALGKKQTASALPKLPEPAALGKSAVAFEGQEYLSALLVDQAGWQKLSDAVGPNLFVTVVSDKFVFVGLMPDGSGLNAFKKTVVDDCTQQERCISPNVYRFRDGQWQAIR